jgi:hypothetical protein
MPETAAPAAASADAAERLDFLRHVLAGGGRWPTGPRAARRKVLLTELLHGAGATQRGDALTGPADLLGRAQAVYVFAAARTGDLVAASVVSWSTTRHPELDDRSPALWADERRDADTLLLVAARDGARLAD